MGLSDLNLRVLIPYFPVLGWGALRTLEISTLAIALSFPLGLAGGLMRLSDNRLARCIATVYVETVRRCSSSSISFSSFCLCMAFRSTP